MKFSKIPALLLVLIFFSSVSFSQDAVLHRLFDNYYEERLKLFPGDATAIGDNRFNDQLPNEGGQQHINQLNNFYNKYLSALKGINRAKLNSTDRVSLDLLVYTLNISKEGLSYHPEYMPATQFRSLALTIGTWGAGGSLQPFKTVKDYENWLKRISAFNIWVDTAIANFNKGIANHVVLPKAMVQKMIPQMEKLAESDSSKSIFFGPIRNFPSNFTVSEKQKLVAEYYKSIFTELLPSYSKLATYLKDYYLPRARKTSGYSSLPDGAARYSYLARLFTTTNKTPLEIYNIGLQQVDMIHKEMEIIKKETGFDGPLSEYFKFLTSDPKFFPFKNAEEVLGAYRAIYKRIQPNLPVLFGVSPKTHFEIRQTESFRAASAAAQYFAGSEDGKRPGIFYVPIVDPLKYPSFSMEDLFLHEAIPGHHYQVSLQSENTTLPRFRRHTGNSAFNEGWALYTETLGKQLGVYTDPYQQMGSLQNQIHRAIRLVVDVGLHTGKFSREEAIKYMRENEPITEQFATSEIERYMATPGQALSYKIGQLKILELRDRYNVQLGKRFNLKNFHDAILMGGSLPLTIFEEYMNEWAKKQ